MSSPHEDRTEKPLPDELPLTELLEVTDIEELNERNERDGWSSVEYRQLAPGPLTGRFAGRSSCDAVHTTEKHNRAVEVHCTPP